MGYSLRNKGLVIPAKLYAGREEKAYIKFTGKNSGKRSMTSF